MEPINLRKHTKDSVARKKPPLTVGLRNVGFFGWKVSPPILLLSKEKCVAPKPTLLKPTAVISKPKRRPCNQQADFKTTRHLISKLTFGRQKLG